MFAMNHMVTGGLPPVKGSDIVEVASHPGAGEIGMTIESHDTIGYEGREPVRDEASRSIRPVIEHALTDYGYSPDTARALVDQLLAEGGGR
jgi:hypothetical protein